LYPNCIEPAKSILSLLKGLAKGLGWGFSEMMQKNLHQAETSATKPSEKIYPPKKFLDSKILNPNVLTVKISETLPAGARVSIIRP
jgi:hypothetical protein